MALLGRLFGKGGEATPYVKGVEKGMGEYCFTFTIPGTYSQIEITPDEADDSPYKYEVLEKSIKVTRVSFWTTTSILSSNKSLGAGDTLTIEYKIETAEPYTPP